MSMRNIDPVVIERVSDVTLKTKRDDKLGEGVMVADFKLKVVANSAALGRLIALMESDRPLQVIISTRQRTFPEPSLGGPGVESVPQDDILG